MQTLNMKCWYGLIVVMVALLTGCAGPQPLVPAPYTVVVTADRNLNPDRNGKPAPVQLTLYRLRGVNAFLGADFFTLYEKDADILGTDLVSKDTLTLMPGESKIVVGKAGEAERMLGVFVAYRDIQTAKWRAVTSLPEPVRPVRAWYSFSTRQLTDTRVNVLLGPNKVSVSTDRSSVQLPQKGGLQQLPQPGSGRLRKPSVPTTIPWSV